MSALSVALAPHIDLVARTVRMYLGSQVNTLREGTCDICNGHYMTLTILPLAYSAPATFFVHLSRMSLPAAEAAKDESDRLCVFCGAESCWDSAHPGSCGCARALSPGPGTPSARNRQLVVARGAPLAFAQVVARFPSPAQSPRPAG